MQETTQLGVLREMRLAIVAMALLIGLGTAGYVFIEGWTALDAFYMTVITVFTVGFREIQPLTAAGQLFTSALIVFGVGIAFWAGASMLQLALSPDARRALRRRRMDKAIADLRDHFIICGFGRIGREVCSAFKEEGVSHAVADTDAHALMELMEVGCPFIQGDCTEDETLHSLGIEHARGLIAVAGTDADNTFIVLSARTMRPDLYIVARATTPEAEKKLRAAGADRVITPYEIGGRRIAALATRPGLVDFLDVAMKGDEADLAMDEVAIKGDSPLAGKTLLESNIRQQTGAIVLAIRERDGKLNSNPGPNATIDPGDVLITLGTSQQLASLVKLARTGGSRESQSV